MTEHAKSHARRDMFLGVSDTILTPPAVALDRGGDLSFQVFIDNGADNGAPTDTPVGTWQLWGASGNGKLYSRLQSTAIDAELDKIKPNGNAVVAAFAIFTKTPGSSVKLLYVATSGGATTRARVYGVVG